MVGSYIPVEPKRRPSMRNKNVDPQARLEAKNYHMAEGKNPPVNRSQFFRTQQNLRNVAGFITTPQEMRVNKF